MEPYYYTKMSKPKQAVYHAIYQGLMALSDSFQVPKLEGRELSDVFFQLRLDHPRSSGQKASITGITRTQRILLFCRSIFLKKER